MLKNKSIGTKITLLLSVVIAIAFTLMSVLSYTQSASSLQNNINSDMQNQAVNNSKIISEKLDGYKMECQEIVLRQHYQVNELVYSASELIGH